MDISVIIPVYNPPRELLEKNIESLLSQEGDFEFIYINDGSTDEWIEDRLLLASNSDLRVRYIYKKNSGVSDTRNRGLDEAKGNYIMFVDADDTMTKDSFNYMLNSAIETDADVSIFGIKIGNPQGRIKKILTMEEKKDIVWSALAYRTQKYSSKALLIDSPCAKLFKREIIKKNKLRFLNDICKSEDAIFDVLFYENSDNIFVDNTIVYEYVYAENSITHSYKYKYVEMIPLYLAAKEDIVNQYHSNDAYFRQAIAIRTIVALMDADHCYFSFSQKGKTFSQQVSEFKQLLNEPVVKSNLKNMNYGMLSQNQLPGFLNKMKLFFYKNDLVEIDMMLYRILHLLKK